MNKADFVPYTLDSIGISPYPELVDLLTTFFENRATKEQLDEVAKHIKATKSDKKAANAYDYFQTNYGEEQPSKETS